MASGESIPTPKPINRERLISSGFSSLPLAFGTVVSAAAGNPYSFDDAWAAFSKALFACPPIDSMGQLEFALGIVGINKIGDRRSPAFNGLIEDADQREKILSKLRP